MENPDCDATQEDAAEIVAQEDAAGVATQEVAASDNTSTGDHGPGCSFKSCMAGMCTNCNRKTHTPVSASGTRVTRVTADRKFTQKKQSEKSDVWARGQTIVPRR